MDQGVSRKLATWTPSVSGVLFEMQRNIFELLERASVLLRTAAHSPEDFLTFQSILEIEECLLTIQRLLQYWEKEMRSTLGKARLSGREETVELSL